MLNLQALPERAVALFVAVGTILVVGCASPIGSSGTSTPATPKVTLTVSGAGGTTAVLENLSEAYTEFYGDIDFKFLEGSGSSGGAKGVNAQVLDLGAMSRLPKESEYGGGLKYQSFAEERVAVVTSPDIVLGDVTASQIKSIFAGEIVKWSELGGVDAPVSVLVREEDDSNTKIFREGIFGDSDFSPAAVVLTSENDTKAALSQSTRAVGYLAYSGVVRDNLRVNTVVIDGNHPGDADSSYPMAPRVLGVAYLPENKPKMQNFLDFITGPVAMEILSRHGLKARK